MPPGGRVKFQTRTRSSSKITREPTKPSISHAWPGAQGLGVPPNSLVGMLNVCFKYTRLNVVIIAHPIYAMPQGAAGQLNLS